VDARLSLVRGKEAQERRSETDRLCEKYAITREQLDYDLATVSRSLTVDESILDLVMGQAMSLTCSDIKKLSRIPFYRQRDILKEAKETRQHLSLILNGEPPERKQTSYDKLEEMSFAVRKAITLAGDLFEDIPVYTLYSKFLFEMDEGLKIIDEWAAGKAKKKKKKQKKEAAIKTAIKTRRTSNRNKYRGVVATHDSLKDVYKARFYNRKDKKHYYIGKFGTEEEAALAYNERAIKELGEHAVLNVVDGSTS
jgi:hypothetical protein